MKERYYKKLFLISAIYDILLGIVFTFFYKPVFSLLGIPLPDFAGYISLIGVFLIVLGVGYYYISRGDLAKNRDLIKIGILYKFAYSSVAFFYLIFDTVPHLIFVWVFGVADLIFAILFIECLKHIKKR
ncbi:MAG: hypothetical protein NTU63_00365 [Candidatus Pacearchaeota archaeon]|nr:hypothetical protein [Candidatus Pacearchaeota archaeon]